MPKIANTEDAERLTSYVIVRLTDEVKARLNNLCHKLGITKSDHIRELVDADLAEREK